MIIPHDNYVHIKVTKLDKLRGIEIPDVHQQDEEEVVEVLALGPEVKKAKVGDIVICRPSMGFKVPAQGEMQAFIRESDIVATVTK